MLTKRLGIGVLASALKKGLISEDDMMPAIEEAAALNAAAAAVMTAVGVHACTDVSGFGLLGHLGEMLDASGAGGRRCGVADVPLHDGVLELIAQAVYAGGLRSNRDFLLPRLSGAGSGRRARPARTRACSPSSTRRPRAACSSPWPPTSTPSSSTSSRRTASAPGRSARSPSAAAGTISLEG